MVNRVDFHAKFPFTSIWYIALFALLLIHPHLTAVTITLEAKIAYIMTRSQY